MTIKSDIANEIIRYIANGLFLFISGLLSVNMFIQFNEASFIKIVFALLAIGLELARYYAFVMGKAHWKRRKTHPYSEAKATGSFLIYAGLAIVVVVASYGFSATALETQSKETETYITQKDSLNKDYVQLNDRIEMLVNQESKLTNYGWRYQEIESKINKLKAQRDELDKKSENFKETKVNVQKTMFGSLGKPLGQSESTMKFILLVLISILLEVSLMATSLEVEIGEEEKKAQAPSPPVQQHNDELIAWLKANKDIMMAYIDGMTDIKYGLKRLNGNGYIMKTKKLKEKDCNLCKSIIQKIKLDGKYLITTVQGSSEANFSKEQMKKAIENIIAEK